MRYEARKNTRIKSQFLNMTVIDSLNDWIYNEKEKKWEDFNSKSNLHSFSRYQECHSFRAFRRKLKKAPKGLIFMLISKRKGNNVFQRNK